MSHRAGEEPHLAPPWEKEVGVLSLYIAIIDLFCCIFLFVVWGHDVSYLFKKGSAGEA